MRPRASLAALCALGAWAAGCHRSEVADDAAWTRVQARLRECEARFPSEAANEAALLVEERAARLGVAFWPREAAGRALPSAREAADFKGIGEPLLRYVESLAAADDTIPEPPEPVRAFLEANGAALEDLRREVLERAPPRWAIGLAQPRPVGPLPDGAAHVRLQRLLIAEASRKSRAGQKEPAEKTMEAAWKINGALVQRPVFVSQMLAIAITRWQMAALRKMEGLSAAWAERLVKRDHRDAYHAAHDCEALASSKGKAKRERAESVEYIEATLALTRELRKQDGCAYTAARARQTFESAYGEGADMPNLQEASYRLFRAEVERELTGLVLEAKRKRTESGVWPAQLSVVASKVCPGAGWSYRVSGPEAVIAFEGRFPDRPGQTFDPPLRYTARAGAGRS